MHIRHKFLTLALVSSVVVGTPAVANEQAFAVLNGGYETEVADPDGYGAAAVLFHTTTTICVAISVSRTGPSTGIHIHRGKAGVSGPIVVPLATREGNPPNSAACYGQLDAALVREIRNFRERFYINVHTNVFPGGAVRGQLF